MLRLLESIFHPRRARHRRRNERERRRLDRELVAYESLISTIERDPPVGPVRRTSAGARTTPVTERAAELLPRLEAGYADFWRAALRIEQQRDSIRTHLRDSETSPEIARPVGERFAALQARHPAAERVAIRDAEWQRRIAQVARWAGREPASVTGSRGVLREHEGEVIFDRGDRQHIGWWHGA
jgi:hypothetical protein